MRILARLIGPFEDLSVFTSAYDATRKLIPTALPSSLTVLRRRVQWLRLQWSVPSLERPQSIPVAVVRPLLPRNVIRATLGRTRRARTVQAGRSAGPFPAQTWLLVCHVEWQPPSYSGSRGSSSGNCLQIPPNRKRPASHVPKRFQEDFEVVASIITMA